MEPQTGVAQSLKIDQLVHLHNLTKDISKLCHTQLRTYLDALAPLFRPRRVLGDNIEGSGKETVVNADQNLAELREVYMRVAPRPFEIRRELATPLASVPTQLQLYEWEYLHDARNDRERKTVTVVSPLTWVIAYSSTYSPSVLRQVLAGHHERDQDSVNAFVLRACLIHLLFAKQPTLAALFEGLRYKVEVRKSPHFGELPLVTISAPVATTRPNDNLLFVATGISGRATFQEVLDVDSARRIPDPLRDEVSRILAGHGEKP